ncbi:MAG: hypothetical protein JST93_25065 [Acidobacteria bacterium]|nr:hypothetical protein [Acidobacteriota bacterium]
MNSEATERLIVAVERWADGHPSPEVPAIRILGRGAMTPKQVASALREQTGAGALLLQVLENAVAESSLEEVLESFDSGKAQSRAVGHGD